MPKTPREKPSVQRYMEQGHFRYRESAGKHYIEGRFDDKAAAKGAIEYLRAENAMPKRGGYIRNNSGVVIEVDDAHQMGNLAKVIHELEEMNPEAEVVRVFNASRDHRHIPPYDPAVALPPEVKQPWDELTHFERGIWLRLEDARAEHVEIRAAFVHEMEMEGASRYMSHHGISHTKSGMELHVADESAARLEDLLKKSFPEIYTELHSDPEQGRNAKDTPLPGSHIREKGGQMSFVDYIDRQESSPPRGKGR